MTTARAVALGLPRWMALSDLSEDLDQIVALVDLMYAHASPVQRSAALRHAARQLRREVWDRAPSRPLKPPSCLRASKIASYTGYRRDPQRKAQVRMKMSAERRREIARMGALARKANANG